MRVLFRLFLGLALLAGLSGPARAEGRIFAVWEEGKSEAGRAIQRELKSKGVYDTLVQALDQVLVMPRDLPVVFAETGKVNAWYDPGRHVVIFSYDLVATVAGMFHDLPETREQALLLAEGAALFVLSHELGHAIIGELDLPTTGKEEDCADEFATLLASEALGEEGRIAGLGAAAFFDLAGSGARTLEDLPFWDEHGLDRQRAYRILCNLYASSPERYAFVRDHVPAERLRLAQERYARKVRNWNRLLAPHEEKN